MTGEQHDEAGVDLAREVTRATAAAATGRPVAPRRTKRVSGGRRSAPPAVSGAHPDERDPQRIDSVVGRVVADRGWELDLRVHGVFARWSELVGPEVGGHSRPEGFSDGKLIVRAESTAWATQLKLLCPALLRRLNEELGQGTVTVIDVLGPHLPTWTKGPRAVRDGRGPRDTYG